MTVEEQATLRAIQAMNSKTLTKREQIATQLMAALITKADCVEINRYFSELTAKAVKCADILIETLEAKE